jgi:hypothetical protein
MNNMNNMNNINYIGAGELLFDTNNTDGVYSGGFNVKSIMMKAGMSPIMTINDPMSGGGSTNKVSDLFDSLVIPSWALSYNIIGQDRIIGQDKIGGNKNKRKDDSDDENNEDIEDDLHDKLLDLVREHDSKITKMNERKAAKRTRKNRKTSKTGTKRVK